MTKIAWAPIVAQEHLAVQNPELFVMQLQRAFGAGEWPGTSWPLTLTTKHLERLEGMAAVDTSVASPYFAIVGHLKRYKQISIWPEREEVVGFFLSKE